MVTRSQIDRLGKRLDALSSIVDPQAGHVIVAVFVGETAELAAQRHVELRPEHRGRLVRFDRRPNERSELHELSAAWAGATAADFATFKCALAEMVAGESGHVFVESETRLQHDGV